MHSEYCARCRTPLEEWECGGICEGCATNTTATKGNTMSNEQRIAQAAMTIAGSIFEDADRPTLTAKLMHCCAWRNRGTDGDLTQADREALQLLLDAAIDLSSKLCNSETGAVIRTPTVEEVCESVLAGPEGHIMVDGVQCYVEL